MAGRPKPSEPWEQIPLRLTASMRAKVREVADVLNRTESDVLRGAVASWLLDFDKARETR